MPLGLLPLLFNMLASQPRRRTRGLPGSVVDRPNSPAWHRGRFGKVFDPLTALNECVLVMMFEHRFDD